MFHADTKGDYVLDVSGIRLRAVDDGLGGILPVDGSLDLEDKDGVAVSGRITDWALNRQGQIVFHAKVEGRFQASQDLIKQLDDMGCAPDVIRLRRCPPELLYRKTNILVIGSSRCGKTTMAVDIALQGGRPVTVFTKSAADYFTTYQYMDRHPDIMKLDTVEEDGIVIIEDADTFMDTPEHITAIMDSMKSTGRTNILTTEKANRIPGCIRSHCDIIILFDVKDKNMRKIVYDQYFSCAPRVVFEEITERYLHNYGAIVLSLSNAAIFRKWQDFLFYLGAGTTARPLTQSQ